MKLLIKYGWYALLLAISGDMLIPFILTPFYKGYHNTLMTISSLGSSNSPVRIPFNIWMLLEGILFLVAVPALYKAYVQVSKPLITVSVLFIIIFAVGACIFTCFFSVNETKDVVTTASILHSIGSVIGFILLLFVPLLLAILSFRTNDKTTGLVSSASYVLAFLFIILFVMADKVEFKGTLVAKEGLWQRMNLLFMYLPLGYISVRNILGLIR